jgi:hypothetical protein
MRGNSRVAAISHRLPKRPVLCAHKKTLSTWEGFFVQIGRRAEGGSRPYFGGAGVNPSRLRPGSGLGFGLGAFFASFLPLSLLPMGTSVTQKGSLRKE